jgi:hypothetical protein
MNSTDIVAMIGNLSQSMLPLQHLIAGSAYILGILFCVIALKKLRKVASGGRQSHEKMFIPLAYFLGGAALFFLPTMIKVMSNTAFGADNILRYTNFNPYDIYSAMGIIIQTVGILWFVRGCYLLVHSSEPGVQHGAKGLAFLCAGILAMNFESTAYFLNTVMANLISLSLKVQGKQ